MQVGAELYGHSGPESDVEVLRLMLATLRSAGHDSTHVDLGHVGIFRGLSRAAGLDTDAEHTLFELLQRKARADIGDFVGGLGLDPAVRDWFVNLPQCFGPIDRLPALRGMLPGVPQPVLAAIDELETISHELLRFEPQLPLFVDLAELRGYHYHSGVVFDAYCDGVSGAVARGGRYDEVGKAFGRPRAATGFSIELRSLAAATTRKKRK